MTAPFLSCFVPTEFAGSTSLPAASPIGVEPRTATISAETRKRLKKSPPHGQRWRTLRDLLVTLEHPADRAEKAADPWHVFVPDGRLYPKHTGSKLDWPAKTVKAGGRGRQGAGGDGFGCR